MSRDSMRVAFDATPLQTKRSGIGMYTENLIRALLETHACEVVLLSNRPPIPVDELGPADRHTSAGFPVRAVWMQAVLPHVLSQVRPSLCHFPNYLAPLRAPCPRVVTFHDMSLHRYPEFFSGRKRYLSRQLIPLVAQRAEGIITVSEYSRREIIELLGVPRGRVHVIYEAAARTYRPIEEPAALESVRRRFELPPRFILSVGTIEPRKNIGRLLAAFEGLADDRAFRDVQLVLVGESGWKNKGVLARIGEAQSRGRVKYLGYLPQEDLPALYSLASVLAYPSIYEGFGLPIVEAMACGTPVLTSDRASMSEIAGSAAYLVDPEDTQSIRRGLETILRHRDLAAALSQRGRDRAARFSWSETAERTLEVYREVLRATKTRPSRAAGGNGEGPPPGDSHSERDPVAPARGEYDRAEMCRSILRTVIYADLFDSPIGIDSLHRDLIGCRATREQVESCLDEDPWLRDRVVRRQDVVLLKGREALADRRRRQRDETRDLIRRNRRLLGLLSLVPFLRMLAFSGGTSHENSPGCPDLDLFIVTARRRVWGVYGLVVLLTRLCGCRRTICANYVVDTDHLRLPRPGDLFTGSQLLFVKPLTGAVWANRLLEQNAWIGELFPNAGTLSKEHLSPGHPRLQRGCEIILSPAWLLWERIAQRLFRPRIDRQARASAAADVLVGDGILKLHIQDRRAPAIARFRERLRNEGVWHPALESCLWLGRGPGDPALPVVGRADAMSARSTAIAAAPTADALCPGPCDLLLVHPYSLALDDARFYELLPHPPLGLLMIAAVARAQGYRVAIYDGTFSDHLRDLGEFLRRHPPRLVGVGSWSSYRANTRRVIEEVRRAGLPVLAGGPDPSIYPAAYLEAGAGAVVIGEGEETVKELLAAVLGPPGSSSDPAVWDSERLRSIPGLAFRGDGAEGDGRKDGQAGRPGGGTPAGGAIVRTPLRSPLDRLDDLPLPAYDLVPTDRYLRAWNARSGFTSLPIMSARGCPFRCTWCARPSFGRIYRQRSVASVLQEVQYLVGTLGARYLRIVDDTFVIRTSWIEEWSRAVRASGLDFRYECLARVELLTDRVVEALKSSGCVKIFCGVESGSQAVLDAMKKDTTLEQIESAGRRLHRAGIPFHAYLMFGYPGERHRDVRRTMDLLRRLRPDEHSISVAYPMPGTEFYELVKARLPERRWKNRDDVEPQFETDYSALYLRLARAIARRRYAPGHPRDLVERVEGWLMEVLFFFVRWRDELTRPGRSPAPGSTEPRGSNAPESRGKP